MEARRGHRSGDPVVKDVWPVCKHKTLNQCWLNASWALQKMDQYLLFFLDIAEKDFDLNYTFYYF